MNSNREKIGLIIQARLGSTRFPGKVLKPFCEGTVLEYLVRRLKNAFEGIPIIIATSVEKNDDQIVNLLMSDEKVAVFRGNECDVLDRFVKCAKMYELRKFVRVCADNPFLDIDGLRRLVDIMSDKDVDYVSYFIEDVPTIKTHFGLWAEGVSLDALERVQRGTSEKKYLEHVTNYIYENSDLFKIERLSIPDWFPKHSPIRMTMDTENDYASLRYVCGQFNCGDVSLQRLVQIVENDKVLLNNMRKEILLNKK